MSMTAGGTALCVPGITTLANAELLGRDVRIYARWPSLWSSGTWSPRSSMTGRNIYRQTGEPYVLDDGRLVFCRAAGLKWRYKARLPEGFAISRVRRTRANGRIRTTVRYNWAAEYRGRAMVVYGTPPVPETGWLNRTINIDTVVSSVENRPHWRYSLKGVRFCSSAHTYYESA